MKTAAVIGAGIGGLAISVRLAAKGYQVDVFEKESYPGGKLAELKSNGFRFDLGPSRLTQPERVEALFHLMGENPSDYFTYKRLPAICRYFWPDGTRLDVPSGPNDFAYACRDILGADPSAISHYLTSAQDLYSLAAPLFIDQPFPTLKAFQSPVGRQIANNLFTVDPFVTLHRRNARSFKDPRMVQLFDRYATYNGSNPYKAPATLKMTAHPEHNLGAFFPDQGMYSIVREIAKLAVRSGVRFHYNSIVQRVNRNTGGEQVTGIRIDGKDFSYPLVVSDMDVNTFYRSGMIDFRSPKLGRKQPLSTSALIFYWGVEGNHDQLDLHNILFAENYREEFKHLFKLKKMYTDPTIYIYISSKREQNDALPGHENWFVMVNAPESSEQIQATEINRIREILLKKINRLLGIDLSGKIVYEHIEDPGSIERRTGSWHGSLYGKSSNSRISAFSRHPNRRSKINGLYFTGGSVHPGGGIPLCLASAEIVANLIDQ